jgi:hypothetical protein
VRPYLFSVIAATLAALGLSLRADEVRGLSAAEFEKLHQELRTCREPWQSIPWRLSVLEARAQAAQERKPVYMLVRSGHPLGCV